MKLIKRIEELCNMVLEFDEKQYDEMSMQTVPTEILELIKSGRIEKDKNTRELEMELKGMRANMGVFEPVKPILVVNGYFEDVNKAKEVLIKDTAGQYHIIIFSREDFTPSVKVL